MLVERLLQPFRLPHIGVKRPVVEWVDALIECFGIPVDDQLDAGLCRDPVPLGIHVTELPGGVDVKQGERQRRREECLPRKVQHDG